MCEYILPNRDKILCLNTESNSFKKLVKIQRVIK